MLNKSFVGAYGEDLACKYLKSKGYDVLRRNDKHPWGEIDIIVKHKKTKLLVFVEVKTLLESRGFSPEGNYSYAKAHKTKRAAQLFAGRYSSWYEPEVGWRIDLIAISLRKVPITSFTDCIIRHYENV